MAVVPGYKYLGPGNSINKGPPVNEVDLVAQIHDLEYSTAQSDEDIRKADAKAIDEFYEAPVSFGSLVGEVGIGAKYIVESETGVLYGGGEEMKGKFNIGQELYKSRQKAIYNAFRRAVHEGTHHDLNSFRETDEYRTIIAEHKKGGKMYNQLLTQNTNVPQSTSERRPDDEPATSRRRVDSNQESDFDWEAYIDSIVADLPDQTVASLPSEQSMDIPQSGSDRGPNTGSRSQEATSTNDGRSAIVRISKSLPASTSTIIFKKSRILYSYGYATKTVQPASSVDDWFTTSMALIPVDFLPFYLSHSEYTSLPEGARIKEVTCTVYPLGTRTAFDTGTTLSGSATSEYIPIGLSAVGLNVDFYGCNKKYTTSATKPMVPTGITDIVCKKIVKKYYESSSSNAMCIPRSISEYYCHNWNRSTNPDTNKYPLYQIHNAGVVHMDQKVEQFLINTAINQPIIQYMYIPKNGYINSSKEHFIPYGKRDNTVYSEFIRSRSNHLKHFETSNSAPIVGELGLGNENAPPVVTNNTIDGYNRKIENYGSFNHQTGTTSYAAQPQVHVGIQATPQLNPANEETNFLNSCAYWKVECTCIIDFTISSAFTKNSAISWPTKVHFLPQNTTNYTDGSTLFGNTDEGTGVIKRTMGEIIDDEFELLHIPNKKKK